MEIDDDEKSDTRTIESRSYDVPWLTCVACGVRDSNVIAVAGRGLHEDALRCHKLRLKEPLDALWTGDRIDTELSTAEQADLRASLKEWVLVTPDYEPMKKDPK